jgi:hypothetical protein
MRRLWRVDDLISIFQEFSREQIANDLMATENRTVIKGWAKFVCL